MSPLLVLSNLLKSTQQTDTQRENWVLFFLRALFYSSLDVRLLWKLDDRPRGSRREMLLLRHGNKRVQIFPIPLSSTAEQSAVVYNVFINRRDDWQASTTTFFIIFFYIFTLKRSTPTKNKKNVRVCVSIRQLRRQTTAISVWPFEFSIHTKTFEFRFKSQQADGRRKKWRMSNNNTHHTQLSCHHGSSLTLEYKVLIIPSVSSDGSGGGIVLYSGRWHRAEDFEEDRVRSIYLIPSHPIIWLLLWRFSHRLALVFIEKKKTRPL
jgi:hypothetical protein